MLLFGCPLRHRAAHTQTHIYIHLHLYLYVHTYVYICIYMCTIHGIALGTCIIYTPCHEYVDTDMIYWYFIILVAEARRFGGWPGAPTNRSSRAHSRPPQTTRARPTQAASGTPAPSWRCPRGRPSCGSCVGGAMARGRTRRRGCQGVRCLCSCGGGAHRASMPYFSMQATPSVMADWAGTEDPADMTS